MANVAVKEVPVSSYVQSIPIRPTSTTAPRPFAASIADRRRAVLISCVFATALSASAFVLAGLEAIGACGIAHPLFWLPIGFAAFGVAGSTFMRLWADMHK